MLLQPLKPAQLVQVVRKWEDDTAARHHDPYAGRESGYRWPHFISLSKKTSAGRQGEQGLPLGVFEDSFLIVERRQNSRQELSQLFLLGNDFLNSRVLR